MVIFEHSIWSIQFQSAFKFDSNTDFIPLNPSKAPSGRFSPKRYEYINYLFGEYDFHYQFFTINLTVKNVIDNEKCQLTVKNVIDSERIFIERIKFLYKYN